MNDPEPESPYEEALRLLSEGEARKAADLLDWAGRKLDPLAHDEARAEVDLSLRRYGAALEGAERTLRAGRETPRLHMIAAEAQLHLGLRAEAEAHLERVGDDEGRAVYLRSRIAYLEARFEEAERLAERASALGYRWDAVRHMALAARMMRGDRDAWIELLEDWRRTRARTALLFLMEYVGEEGAWETGSDLLREIRAEGIADSTMLAWTMRLYLVRKEDAEAIRTYEESPETVRDALDPLRMRGYAAARNGRPAEALPYYERAFALEPLHEQGLQELAGVLFRLRRWRRLMEVFKEHSAVTDRDVAGGDSMRRFFLNERWRKDRANRTSRKRR